MQKNLPWSPKEIDTILNHYFSSVNQPKLNWVHNVKIACVYIKGFCWLEKNTYDWFKLPFTRAITDSLNPLFVIYTNKLSSDNCKQNSSQNANEYLVLFAKGRYCSPLETSLAINLVVSTYNSGMTITVSKLLYWLTFLSIGTWKINGKIKIRKEYTKLITSTKKDPN